MRRIAQKSCIGLCFCLPVWENNSIMSIKCERAAAPLRDNVFLFKLNIGGLKSMSKKYVYQFSEGNASMRNLLGGKGANLAEMTKIGLPVPQGFTISTEACTQ